MTEAALFPEVVAEEARRQERHTSYMLRRAVPQAFAILATVGTGYLRMDVGPLVRWVNAARQKLKDGDVDEAGAVLFLARALVIDTYGPQEAEERLEEARAFLQHLARTL